MAEEKRVTLTAEEVSALRYCDDRGLALPAWLQSAGTGYTRPARLTPEQFEDYAARLSLYDQHAAAEALQKVKTWITVLGVLAVIGILVSFLT